MLLFLALHRTFVCKSSSASFTPANCPVGHIQQSLKLDVRAAVCSGKQRAVGVDSSGGQRSVDKAEELGIHGGVEIFE